MDSLGRILTDHTDELMKRWLETVRGESLGKRGLTEAALKDDLPLQLQVIGDAMKAGVQTPDELWTGEGAEHLDTEERVLQQVPIEEVVDEYAYIVDVVRRWLDEHSIEVPFEEFSFFHTAIFELTSEAVRRYSAYQAERVEDLQNHDRRTIEFLGVLSHELRNPLAAIQNGLHILDRVKPAGPQARRARCLLERQVEHLRRLVDDLLDITRVARGKIHLQCQRLDLVELVRQSLEDHEADLEERDVTLDLPSEPVWVNADRVRISQAIGNLLVNAGKFTPPPNARICLSLAASEDRAVLTVEDTGIGMMPAAISHLFEPFAQADHSIDRSQGGLGLGLALVKGIVEQHGGKVSANSAGLEQGSCFTITLPLDENTEAAIPPPEATSLQETARDVLIIEDNKDAADSLCELLTLSGHRVVVAYDGRAGLTAAREFHPDVVLCDIGLPNQMDGYAVARELRLDPATAQTALIALTGYAQPSDRRLAREAGFDDHVAKPPDLETLERLLRRALP